MSLISINYLETWSHGDNTSCYYTSIICFGIHSGNICSDSICSDNISSDNISSDNICSKTFVQTTFWAGNVYSDALGLRQDTFRWHIYWHSFRLHFVYQLLFWRFLSLDNLHLKKGNCDKNTSSNTLCFNHERCDWKLGDHFRFRRRNFLQHFNQKTSGIQFSLKIQSFLQRFSSKRKSNEVLKYKRIIKMREMY